MGLTIGQFAERSGVNLQTIRYYEREGLLPEPARLTSGYRIFPLDPVRRVQFIKRAQGLGFSLAKVRELLSLRETAGAGAQPVRERAKIVDIEEKIRALRAMRDALNRLVERCPGCGPLSDCPILDALDAKGSADLIRGPRAAAARVLVVDDDRLILNVLTETLSGCGYAVRPASGPREALNIVRNEPPFDVVLSDVVMPEMDGPQLVREIVHVIPETAWVLMTGGLCTQLPPDVALLHKPFLRNDLVTVVERAIARSADLGTKLPRVDCKGVQTRSGNRAD